MMNLRKGYIYRVQYNDNETAGYVRNTPNEIFPAGELAWDKDSFNVRNATLRSEGDSNKQIADIEFDIPHSYVFTEYTLEDENGAGDTYSATVSASEYETNDTGEEVVSTWVDSNYTDKFNFTIYGRMPGGFRSPDIRLKAYDGEGNLIGFDNQEREYKTEVPGINRTDVSGNGRQLE